MRVNIELYSDLVDRGLEISIDGGSLKGAAKEGSAGSNKRSRYGTNDRLAELFEEIANFEEQVRDQVVGT